MMMDGNLNQSMQDSLLSSLILQGQLLTDLPNSLAFQWKHSGNSALHATMDVSTAKVLQTILSSTAVLTVLRIKTAQPFRHSLKSSKLVTKRTGILKMKINSTRDSLLSSLMPKGQLLTDLPNSLAFQRMHSGNSALHAIKEVSTAALLHRILSSTAVLTVPRIQTAQPFRHSLKGSKLAIKWTGILKMKINLTKDSLLSLLMLKYQLVPDLPNLLAFQRMHSGNSAMHATTEVLTATLLYRILSSTAVLMVPRIKTAYSFRHSLKSSKLATKRTGILRMKINSTKESLLSLLMLKGQLLTDLPNLLAFQRMHSWDSTLHAITVVLTAELL